MVSSKCLWCRFWTHNILTMGLVSPRSQIVSFLFFQHTTHHRWLIFFFFCRHVCVFTGTRASHWLWYLPLRSELYWQDDHMFLCPSKLLEFQQLQSNTNTDFLCAKHNFHKIFTLRYGIAQWFGVTPIWQVLVHFQLVALFPTCHSPRVFKILEQANFASLYRDFVAIYV